MSIYNYSLTCLKQNLTKPWKVYWVYRVTFYLSSSKLVHAMNWLVVSSRRSLRRLCSDLLILVNILLRAARRARNPGFQVVITYLHGKTGNSCWRIKWFALFRLGSFRNMGCVLGNANFLLFLVSSTDLDKLCSGLFSHHVKFFSVL